MPEPTPSPVGPTAGPAVPAAPAAADDRTFRIEPAAFAVALASALRRAGIGVGPDRAGWFAEAIRLVPPSTRSELYWTARSVFLTARDQTALFDRVFEAIFAGESDWADYRGAEDSHDLDAVRRRTASEERGPWPASDAAPGGPAAPRPGGSGEADEDDSATAETLLMAASREERLHCTAFDALGEEELAELRRLVASLAVRPPMRPARRDRVSPYGPRIDLRRTARVARRMGGEPARLIRAEPRLRARRIVLIADVSASMEPYVRVFLSLMQGLVASRRAEAFVFATRLSRLTRHLATKDPDRALEAAAGGAEDWASGTRLADGIRTFIDDYGRRGIARGAVVVILSDGWAQDDPADIAAQMARLSRLASRIVWVNPRKAARGYQPLAGGMAAALPYVDAFVSGHSYAALQELVRAIADDGSEPRKEKES